MQMYHCKDCTEDEAHKMFVSCKDCTCHNFQIHMMCCLEPEDQAKFKIDEIATHLHKHHQVDIRLAGCVEETDSHGHYWYCFTCNSKSGNDHRSFDSDQALFDHLRDVHWILMRIAGSASAPP